jgi:dolichyl-diphosphooligosaccharide--protein glycosyltransferase
MDSYYDRSLTKRLSWLQRYSEPIFVGILVLLYLFLANYFSWNITFGAGAGGIATLPTSGGSDPYYNFRIILYILQYHVQLIHDPALAYPFGSTNPRNPFFHWLVVLVAEIMSVHMNVQTAAFYAFEELDAATGALLIIPVYLIAKEGFGKKAGLIAALLYTIMPTNLSSGILSGGRMHTPELLFAFFAIYFIQKSINLFEKKRLFTGFSELRQVPGRVKQAYSENMTATIYALMGGAALGGLMLAWQGYAYIEAIILIYFVVQYLFNIILKRPSEYLTLILVPFILLSFAMGAYYYQDIGEGPGWYNAELMVGLLIILFGVVVNAIGRRPWILVFPVLIAVAGGAIVGADIFAHSLFIRLISGDGYFIKTRVYDTIAEAQGITLSTLGQYIAGFGVAPFFLGLAGILIIIYRSFKAKSDQMLYLLVFSLVSIYMSFAAVRFNITAAPAYAILGGALVAYLIKVVRFDDLKNRKKSAFATFRSSVKGSIKWTHAAFAVIIVLILIIPAGLSLVSAAVPENSASSVGNQFSQALPTFLRTNNTSSLLGQTGYAVENSSQPLALSFKWLANQDAQLPITDKPAYLSWWDYGFQELYQGKHPTVADDFQQGIPQAGQALLSQNESQIVGDLIAIYLSANFQANHNNFSSQVKSILVSTIGEKEYRLLLEANKNPNGFKSDVLSNPTVYGKYISGISSSNTYYAFVKGNLSFNFPMSVLNNLESSLSKATGYNIGYIQIDHNLFPSSPTSPGIFYAPSYLTDTPSYVTPGGSIVPTDYYNIEAITSNGSYLLNDLPSSAVPITYDFLYNSSFYNTSIYRFTIGYPPSAVGQSDIIPGLTSSTQNDTPMPAWNMSNFELVYSLSLYNPHKNYQNYPGDFKYIPLQTAYKYQQEGKGFEDLIPPATDFLSGADPIVEYFPGAIIQGKVTTSSGAPVPGVRVTVFDQYGIPHQTVVTNASGDYSVIGLPGNDTVYFSTGSLNSHYLVGSNVITSKTVNISDTQAERQTTGYNSTTGDPNYYVNINENVGSSYAQGQVFNQFQNIPNPSRGESNAVSNSRVLNGNLILTNSTYNLSYNTTIKDGNYNVSVPPVSYEVSVYTNGTLLKDVQQVNVTSSKVFNNIYITYDAIFANLSTKGKLSQNISISASNNGPTGKMVGENISRSGYEVLWVTPGNYSISVNQTGLSSYSSSVSFTGWGLNKTSTLNPLPGIRLNLTISGYRQGDHAYLLPNGSFSEEINVSGDNGFISSMLPAGVYSIYAYGNGYAALKTLILNSSRNMSINMTPASTISLNSTVPNHNSFTGYYEVMSGSGFLKKYYGQDNYLNLSMPNGMYTIDGVATYSGILTSASVQVSLNTMLRETLVPVSNGSQAVLVYNKAISSGYTSKAAITDGVVSLYSQGTPVGFSKLSSTGSALIYLPEGYPDLTAKFISASFHNSTASVSSGSTASIGASPYLVSQQLVFTNQNGKSISGSLTLTGLNGIYNYTISGGLVNINVPVGFYHLTIHSSSYYVRLSKNYLVLTKPVASIHISVYTSINLKVSGSSTAFLYNVNGTIISNLTRVLTGDYHLYALNSTGGLNVTYLNLNRNLSLSPSYSPSLKVNLSNSESNSGGEYYLNSSKYNIPTTSESINVFPGTYNISYRNSLSNSTGSFVFYGFGNYVLHGPTNVNISVARETVKESVSGEALLAGKPAADVTVILLNSSGYMESKTVSNSTGYYHIGNINTGDVSLYAIQNSTESAYLASATIPGFGNLTNLNLTLGSSVDVRFGVNIGSKMVNLPVNISHGSAIYVVNSSQPSVVLPVGTYSFSASELLTQTMPNGTLSSITYSTSRTLSVNSSELIPLSLEKIVEYSFSSNLTSKIVNSTVGSSFTYDFLLKNNGNSPDNVTLSSPTTAWTEVFNTSRLYMVAGSEMHISVNITQNSLEPAGTYYIPVKVDYSSGSSDIYLPVNITSVKSYKVEIMPDIFTNNSDYVVPVKIINTGSVSDSIAVSINTTQSLSYGWNSSIQNFNASHGIVNLPFNKTDTVYVVFSLNSTHFLKTFSTTLNTTSSNLNFSKTITVSVTSKTSVSSITSSGNGVIPNYVSDPFFTLEIGIIVIVVAVVGGLITVAYRGRRR